MTTAPSGLAAAMEYAATLPDRQRAMAHMLVEHAKGHFHQDLIDTGRWHLDELREVCRQVATLLPDSPLVHRTAAFCEARAGDYDAACAALRRFLALAPGAGYDSRRELLRLELIRPDSSAESRAATIPAALAHAGPIGRESYQAQSRVAAGEAPDRTRLDALVDAELARCDARLAEKTATGDADAIAVAAILARLRTATGVALVGNGPSVRGRGLGPEIEAHDCVVRFNFPMLAEFHADVGQRTDLMLIDASHRATMPTRIAWDPHYPSVPALATSGGDRAPGQPPPPGLPQDYVELGTNLAYERGTTGFRAIVMVALALRRPVTLYGFDFFPPGQDGHYFGAGTASIHHEVGYEAWFVRRFLPGILPDLRIA